MKYSPSSPRVGLPTTGIFRDGQANVKVLDFNWT